MRLNGGGPHTVKVTTMKPEKTKYGTWKKVPQKPIELKGVTVQPFGAGTLGRLESNDDSVRDQFTIRGHDVWPGGVHSLVEWEGQMFDQVGKVKNWSIGQYTKHFEVRIQARGAKVE